MPQLSKDFKFKKQFGQNFILDKNYMSNLVKNFNLNKDTNVLEIGAGAGVLTDVLASNFKKVISFEIDKTLTEHLLSLQDQHNNLQFVFKDVLLEDTACIDNMFNSPYVLIANLPYYITSQIIFKFLLSSKYLNNMFVMVQKEVGIRFGAVPCTKDYGIPTVLINTFGDCKIIKNVPRTVFTPQPNVDSCILQIKIDKIKFNIKNATEYSSFVSGCFKMKRKTLYNNLTSCGFNKEEVLSTLANLNLTQTIRPEQLSAQDFVKLYNALKNKN